MRIAIMGAGLAGLCCAKRLEQYGIGVEVFEKRHRVGERFANMEAIIFSVHRPFEDPLIFLSKNYNISLVPSGMVHTIEVNGPSKKALIKGRLGYTTIRGHDRRSLEQQLFAKVESKINYNCNEKVEELAKKFDFVIVATGDPTISMDMGIWKTDLEVFVKGGHVEGSFDTGIIRMWLDYDLTRLGYIFSAAFDEHNAALALAATPSNPEELDILWDRTVKYLRIGNDIQHTFKLEEYKMGRCRKRQVDNIIFTGNAAGFIDPFLGFGQLPSMLSGIYAAEAIALGKDYQQMVKSLVKRYEHCLKIREFMNTLTNKDLDLMETLLNSYFIKGAAFSTSLPGLKVLSSLSKPLRIMKNKLRKKT